MGITQHFLSVQFFDSFKMAMGDSCMGRGSVNPMNMSVFDLGSIRAYIAEFIATMLFVFIATATVVGAAVINGSLAFGLTIVVLVYTVGHISGAHINPAITAGLMSTGHIEIVKGFIYMVVQIVGAIVGSALVRAMFSSSDVLQTAVGLARNGFNTTRIEITPTDSQVQAVLDMNLTAFEQNAALEQLTIGWHDIKEGNAFAAEFIIAFFLVFVVMATAVDPKTEGNRGFAGIAIGYCVAVCHFATIWVSGTSLNPARNIGPNVAQGEAFPDGWYISFFVPFLGGIVGALCYQWIFMDSYAGEDKAVEEENNDEFSAAADADADASISGSASDVSSVTSSSV